MNRFLPRKKIESDKFTVGWSRRIVEDEILSVEGERLLRPAGLLRAAEAEAGGVLSPYKGRVPRLRRVVQVRVVTQLKFNQDLR